jgi:hypothetical protein
MKALVLNRTLKASPERSNRGPGAGEDYLDREAGREWSRSTGGAAASLHAVASALAKRPMPAPAS